MAAKYGKVDVAELLLERGANSNAAGKVCILSGVAKANYPSSYSY